MTDIICIDGSFSKEALIFYKKYGVITPSQDKIYTVRDVIINSIGKTGILLEELINPKIPTPHPIMGSAEMEPNWDINRFRNLDNTEISAIELQQTIKENGNSRISTIKELFNS